MESSDWRDDRIARYRSDIEDQRRYLLMLKGNLRALTGGE